MNEEDKLVACLRDSSASHRYTRQQLAALTGLDDRTIRQHIHDLRKQGLHICADSHTPGYYIGTFEEWDRFCERQRRQMLNGLFRKSTEYDGQIELKVASL